MPMSASLRTIAEQTDENIGFFGPTSITWRLASEAALLLGGGRAVLMQIAHPLVAAGVAQYSSYRSDPWKRTNQTVELVSAMTFGTRSEALAAAQRINRLHTSVSGELSAAAGRFDAGAAFSAKSPDLLRWVHATLVDTMLVIYPLLVRPLTTQEQEAYYQESKRFVALLGLPESRLPPTLASFHMYMRQMLASDGLALLPEAREVAAQVLHMPVPRAVRPAFALAEQATIGLLPPRLRDAYGFTWDTRRQRLLDVGCASVRAALPLMPSSVRYVPWARAAYRRTASTLP